MRGRVNDRPASVTLTPPRRLRTRTAPGPVPRRPRARHAARSSRRGKPHGRRRNPRMTRRRSGDRSHALCARHGRRGAGAQPSTDREASLADLVQRPRPPRPPRPAGLPRVHGRQGVPVTRVDRAAPVPRPGSSRHGPEGAPPAAGGRARLPAPHRRPRPTRRAQLPGYGPRPDGGGRARPCTGARVRGGAVRRPPASSRRAGGRAGRRTGSPAHVLGAGRRLLPRVPPRTSR